MANNLFPVGYEEEIVLPEEFEEDGPIGYRNGAAFDEKAGDFLRDGMNKIQDSDGVESWRSWCFNCLNTQRYAHLAYSSDFGIDTEAAFLAESADKAESILTREISEAILADPYQRAAFIEEIAFDWVAADSLVAAVTIRGIDDVSIDVLAYITKGV